MSLNAIIYSIKTSDMSFGISAPVGPGCIYLLEHVFVFIYLYTFYRCTFYGHEEGDYM